MPVVIALSLLAAFLFAASAAMQQHAVRAITTPEDTQSRLSPRRRLALPVVRLIHRLTRSRLWLAGVIANVSGSLVQAGALHFGSIALVQLILVTQLVFALPLGSAWDRRWPRATDWISSLAICGGLAVFFTVPGTAPIEGTPDRWRVVLATVCAAALVLLLVAAAAGRRAASHAAMVAVAAGICFAITAVLIKVTLADLLERGVKATALDWVGYGLAVATLCGFLLEQEAFAAGSLTSAVSAMTITNPVASYFLGVLAFHAALPTSVSSLAALTGAATLVSAGVIGLAHSPIVRREFAK